MRRKRRFPLTAIVLTLGLLFGGLGFGLGYYRYYYKTAKQEKIKNISQIDENKFSHQQTGKQDHEELSVNTYDDVIMGSTVLIYETLHTQCQDITEEEMEPELEMIGLNEKGFRDYLQSKDLSWDIIEFSQKEVILRDQKNDFCSNHYLLSTKDDYIVIYRLNEKGEKELLEKTEISIHVLPTVDQEKIKRGILLDTLEEVHQLLEDYSS